MPTMVSGTRGTGNILAAKRVVDMSDEIALLDPARYPLLAILTGLGKDPVTMQGAGIAKKSCFSPKFEWLEDEFAPRWDAINDATPPLAADTTWTVDNGAYFTVGDIVKVPRTGEVVRVTAVTGNDLTVVRSIGGTAAANMLDNDPLQIIGNANQEGSKSRNLKTTQSVAKFNYTQIFKNTIGATRTLQNSKVYGGKDLDYERKKIGVEHMVDVERAFLFGEKSEDTSGTHPVRTSGGVLEFVASNIQDEASSSLTETEFETFCETLFTNGSTKKYLFASGKVISQVNAFSSAKLQTRPGEKLYGVQVMNYLSAHGELVLVRHQLLTGAVYGGYGIGLDLDALKYRFLENRDTKLKLNIQDNDADEEKDEYLTECGLEMRNEKRHAVLKGVA